MLARTLLDEHYRDLGPLTLAVADALAAQAAGLDCACVQVDEANIPGNPADGPLAAEAINRVLSTRFGDRRPCISVSATTAAKPSNAGRGRRCCRFSTASKPITWCWNSLTVLRRTSMRFARSIRASELASG